MAEKKQTEEQTYESTGATNDPATVVQNTMDTLTSRIADHPKTSFSVRLCRAAKAGVERERLNKAISIVQEALDDAQAALDRYYEAPPEPKKREKIEVPSRASL